MRRAPVKIFCHQNDHTLSNLELDDDTLRFLALDLQAFEGYRVEWEIPIASVSGLTVQTRRDSFFVTPVIHTVHGDYDPGRVDTADFAMLCAHLPQVPIRRKVNLLSPIEVLDLIFGTILALPGLFVFTIAGGFTMGVASLTEKLGELIILFLLFFWHPDIGELERIQNVKGLIIALRHQKERDVRQAAAAALGRIKDQRAVKPLIAALQDKEWAVRMSAVRALGWIGDSRAIAPLTALLQDKEEQVRKEAVRALGEIGDSRAIAPLLVALQDANASVRSRAAKALGEIKDPCAIEPLCAALQDMNEDVRRFAAKALGEIGDWRAIVPLRAALKDTNEDVRRFAAAALSMCQKDRKRPIKSRTETIKRRKRIR